MAVSGAAAAAASAATITDIKRQWTCINHAAVTDVRPRPVVPYGAHAGSRGPYVLGYVWTGPRFLLSQRDTSLHFGLVCSGNKPPPTAWARGWDRGCRRPQREGAVSEGVSDENRKKDLTVYVQFEPIVIVTCHVCIHCMPLVNPDNAPPYPESDQNTMRQQMPPRYHRQTSPQPPGRCCYWYVCVHE